ncbi:MAG: A/G-specific adenine glycosylase [Planctomycetota bacterium]
MPETLPNTKRFPIDGLLQWFGENQRDLPFRPTAQRKPNPYHVLISEAMAQQTQIATVVPYFHRFVAAFPTVHDLADAEEQAVLNLWQGLGYYSRARNLRKAARMIVDEFGGEVPRTPEELLQLPGVGRYTAGAVASVAYNTVAPIVDGNVARVFARYFGITDPVNQPAGQKKLWALAAELVAASGSPRDFNQGVMELGALVCTPKPGRGDGCVDCPLSDTCVAHATGREKELPVKAPKKKPIAVTHTVLAVERGGRYLFEQRPGNGLWANMWQLPTLETGDITSAPAHLEDRFRLKISETKPVTRFTHQTTHRTICFEVHQCSVEAGRLRPGRGQWRTPDNLQDLPLAKPQQTAVSHL